VIDSDVDRFAGVLLRLATTVHHKTTIEEVADELLSDHTWSDVLAAQELVGKLKTIYDDLRRDSAATFEVALSRFSELVDEVEAWDDVQAVWLPIVGVALPDGEVQLGSARVRPLDEETTSEVTEHLAHAVQKHKSPSNQNKVFVDHVAQRIVRLRGLWEPALLELHIKASPARALELGQERRTELVDLLRARSLAMFSRKQRAGVGAPGELPSDIDEGWAVSTTTSKLSMSASVRGPLQPFLLTHTVADELAENGAFGFFSLIEKPPSERTEMEELLLTAVHWIADSALQPTQDNQLLSLFIGLETLLTTGRTGITRDLVETVAFLLERDLDRRRWVRDNLRALYEDRGKIAHRGGRGASEEAVDWLTNVTIHILQRLLARRDEFSDRRKLAKWVDTCRLT